MENNYIKSDRILFLLIYTKYKSNKFFLIVLVLFSFFDGFGQVLISPTGDGGFENGTTFAANGWTVVNEPTDNVRNWYIGTGQTGYTGNRCAFIGNNATNVGNNNSARIVHFYRSITIPTGSTNIQLAFKYKQETSDYISPTYYDFISVSTSATAPTNGNESTGILQFGPYPNSDVTNFTTQNVILPNTLAGTTTNLIFSFKCDNFNPRGFGAVDDISLTFTPAVPCTTPTAQPTSLVLTPTSANQINGSFTAASPAPNNYLVVRSLLSTPPTLANGTNYALGSTIGLNYTVVDNDTNTIFSASGLNASTLYYFYIYSFNSACSGGPLYNKINPLTGNSTTLSVSYCTPTVANPSTLYIRKVKFQGTLNDVENISTFTLTGQGYQDFTGVPKAIQAQGEGMNIYTEGNNPGTWRVWVDWNKDGTFATSEQVYTNSPYTGQTTDFGFIIPATTAPGNYRIRMRMRVANSTYSACENFTGTTYGETEDYEFTVIPSCSALITGVTDGVTCGTGTVNLSATSSGSPSQYRWYSAKTGGVLVGTSSTGTWTTPTILINTTYYVTAFNGCESVERTAVVAKINPLPSLNFSNPNPVVCGESDVLVISASSGLEDVTVFNEKFDSGLGIFSSVNNDSNTTAHTNLTKWRNTASIYSPIGQVWFPVISSGVGGNTFAFATSDIKPTTASNPINNYLQLTNNVSTMDFTTLNLSIRVFYSRYLPDNNSIYSGTFYRDDLTIEVYDGTSWSTVQNYAEDIGIGTAFKTLNFDLSAFVNKPTLKIRVNHYSWSSSSLFFPGGVAIDDIRLSGNKPINPAFSWTSSTPVNVFKDLACTISYNPLVDVANTIYIKPNLSQLESPNYSISVSSNLSNGCVASGSVSVTNHTKLWNGGGSTDWNNPLNWKPNGVPTIDNCIVVNDVVIISGMAFEATGKNLTLKSSGNINVTSGNSLTIKDALTVQTGGIFNLDDTASLVQEGTTNTNSGSISVKRTAKPMKRYDFTYWSSPVSSQTLYNLSPATLGDKYYSWNPISQAWLTHYNGTDTMIDGKGYIDRAPQSFPIDVVNSANFVGTFVGKPNSGDINVDVKGNTSAIPADYKWNLIGNPYPSAIKLDEFLTDSFNSSKINGTIYLWTHNSPPNSAIPGDAIYNYTASDYAAYNGVGGTATSAATVDPLHPIINPSPNTNVPNGFLASGQSFFVRGKADATVKFTNDMREKAGNNQFFRQSNAVENDIEKNRFWLNIRNAEGAFNQALIGYIEGATNDLDANFDGELFGGNYVTIYSINSNKQLTIQGKALPFENSDVVPLGLKTTIAGNFSISLDNFDGLFQNQDIFLKDNLLNVIHNLKTGGYPFAATIGTFENRFEIVYQNEALGISNPEFNPNTIIIYKKDKTIIVNSGLLATDNIQVFDIQGRLLYDAKNINSSETIIKNLPTTDQVLIVQVQTSEGNKVSKKIIF